MAGTEVPAKFEQGGFTSGRRKGPQTLFSGTSPENPDRHQSVPRTCCDQRSHAGYIGISALQYPSEFLVARLQKPQCSGGIWLIPASAQAALRHLAQQEVAENADSLRVSQL